MKWISKSPCNGYTLQTRVPVGWFGFTKMVNIRFDRMWDAIGYFEDNPDKSGPIS